MQIGLSAPRGGTVWGRWLVLLQGRIGDRRYGRESRAMFLGNSCTPLNRAHRPPQRGERQRQSVAWVGLQCGHSGLALALRDLRDGSLYRGRELAQARPASPDRAAAGRCRDILAIATAE